MRQGPGQRKGSLENAHGEDQGQRKGGLVFGAGEGPTHTEPLSPFLSALPHIQLLSLSPTPILAPSFCPFSLPSSPTSLYLALALVLSMRVLCSSLHSCDRLHALSHTVPQGALALTLALPQARCSGRGGWMGTTT